MSQIIRKHGGYRKLKGYQFAQLVHDITVRFCDRYINRFSRTTDQMVQAARSGVQNIAEGSEASATSKKTELKLTQVARASLEELKLDYEDFLRQHGLTQWERHNPLRQNLIDHNFMTADEVAGWITRKCKQQSPSNYQQLYPEFSANAALALINLSCYFLDRQILGLAEKFEKDGGFTERLYKVRSEKRKKRT